MEILIILILFLVIIYQMKLIQIITIGEGQYRDDVGNINNDLVLEFTTKK